MEKDIKELLNLQENDWLDFKQKWPESKVDLLYDIVCMANSLSKEHSRYIVFGIKDDKISHKKTIYGIFKDKNRKNTEDIICLLNDYLEVIPEVEVIPIKYNKKRIIDVLEIKPIAKHLLYTLKKEFSFKGKKISSATIYGRIGSTNTSITNGANHTYICELISKNINSSYTSQDVDTFITSLDSPLFEQREECIIYFFEKLNYHDREYFLKKILDKYLNNEKYDSYTHNVDFVLRCVFSKKNAETNKLVSKILKDSWVTCHTISNHEKIIDIYTKFDIKDFLFEFIKEELVKQIKEKILKLKNEYIKFEEQGNIVLLLLVWYKLIPQNLMNDFIIGLNRTYVGYIGSSPYSTRTNFFSDCAEDKIKEIFKKFNDNDVKIFIQSIEKDVYLKSIIYRDQKNLTLNRLRQLGKILLENTQKISEGNRAFLKILIDENKTEDFYNLINIQDFSKVD